MVFALSRFQQLKVSSSISADDWMIPSGVRNSCDTIDTKWLRNCPNSFSLASVRSNSTSACLRCVMSMPKPRTCGSRLISMISAETSNVPTVPRWVRAWHSISRTEPLRFRSAQNFVRSSRFTHVSSSLVS